MRHAYSPLLWLTVSLPVIPVPRNRKSVEKLGYQDHIMVTGEPFALWVIESAKDISKEFPLPDAGLPVIFTDNQKPYKQRKVRILNSAHTSFVLASYLCGNDIVRQSMQDDDIRNFMLKTIYDEVIPTLSLPEEELKQFAGEVVNRFNNPLRRPCIACNLLKFRIQVESKMYAQPVRLC